MRCAVVKTILKFIKWACLGKLKSSSSVKEERWSAWALLAPSSGTYVCRRAPSVASGLSQESSPENQRSIFWDGGGAAEGGGDLQGSLDH